MPAHRSRLMQLLAVVLLQIWGVSGSHAAMRVTPVYAELAPSAPGNIETFVVHNESDRRIAVVARLARRVVTPSGEEQAPLTDEHLQLFPTHMIIPPHDEQRIRLRWVGPKVSRERAYRLSIEQLPIGLENESSNSEATAGINIMFRYLTPVYVTPPEVTADVTTDARLVTHEGVERLELRVRNAGGRRKVIRRPLLEIRNDSGERLGEIAGGKLEPAVEGFAVLAGSERVFRISPPEILQGRQDLDGLDLRLIARP